MHSFLVRRSARAAALVAVAASALAPVAAQAAGFGAPIVVSGHDDGRGPQVVIAPNGRTAVLYSTEIQRGRKLVDQYRVAIGPSPTQLAPATTLSAASHATWDFPPQLMARPDGGFVVCVPDGSRKKDRGVGCSVAQPDGEFGPLIVLARTSRKTNFTVASAVRPDSSTLVLLSRTFGARDESMRVVFIGPDGTVRRGTTLKRNDQEGAVAPGAPGLVVAPDGTAAIPVLIRIGKERMLPGVRLMPPGGAAFGAPMAIGTEPFTGNVVLDARAGLSAAYFVAGKRGEFSRRVSRLQDGVWTAPQTLPAGKDDAPFWTTESLIGSSPLAIGSVTRTDPDDFDCYNQVFGEVSVAALTPVGGILQGAPTRLSQPGQIADYPQIDALADGTVVATWQYAVEPSPTGTGRVAVAVRSPGSSTFDAPQVFQLYGYFDEPAHLATAGQTAAVVWEGPWRDVTHRVMISSLRDAPPYATQGELPREPGAPCDE